MDKTTQKLCEMIDRELDKIANGNSLDSAGVREALDKLTHAKKSLLTSDAMQNGGSSYDRGYMGSMYGGSYAGNRDMDRDAMGRYDSRDGYNSYGNSREGMMRHLEDMRRSATSDAERQSIDRWMREMGSI